MDGSYLAVLALAGLCSMYLFGLVVLSINDTFADVPSWARALWPLLFVIVLALFVVPRSKGAAFAVYGGLLSLLAVACYSIWGIA